MAEVFVEFDAVLPGPGGATYVPRACGRLGDGGLWEGWIEFSDARSGSVVRTGRETTQPERQDLMYWATGLSRVYLDGALSRALAGPRVAPRATVESVPAFDGPAPPVTAGAPPSARPVLNPFEVYAQGEGILRSELLALEIDHLRTIVRAHGLDVGEAATSPSAAILAAAIVAAVRVRATGAGASAAASSTTRGGRV
jgi:hypothetical protein